MQETQSVQKNRYKSIQGIPVLLLLQTHGASQSQAVCSASRWQLRHCRLILHALGVVLLQGLVGDYVMAVPFSRNLADQCWHAACSSSCRGGQPSGEPASADTYAVLVMHLKQLSN